MKPNRYYKDKQNLEVMGVKINSYQCCNIQITFTIDARHILLAITELLDNEKQTRTNIIKRLKKELFYKGESWYLSPLEYSENGQHYNLKERLKEAVPLAKRLFPEFMGEQAIDFIRKL